MSAADTRPQYLFRVAETFAIRGRGVVVATDCPTTLCSTTVRVGLPIEIRQADGTTVLTQIAGIELIDRHDPSLPFAFMLHDGVTKADVRIGSEVWAAE